MIKLTRFIDLIEKKSVLILSLLITAYTAIFSFICYVKYLNLGYSGFDLAIYNQVFFNSVHGWLFSLTIHPNLYLGDHFEIFILALLPFYYLWQSPITLLILQSLFLAICAWPIYLIAKYFLGKNIYALGFAASWLINPFVQNINLFEFHLLPFALIFILFAFYYYLKNNFNLWLLFSFIALTTREDIALVIFMFGILAIIEKKPLKWILTPLIIGCGWFIIAMKAINYFTPAGSYKFLSYYSWLGNSFSEIVINFFLKFYLVLSKLLAGQNILFILGILVPFGFIPVLKPKYLLLALPILLQTMLTNSSNSFVMLRLHYTALLLPALFLCSLDFFKNSALTKKWKQTYQQLIVLIFIAGVIYGFFSMGLGQLFWQKQISANDNFLTEKNKLLKEIDSNSSVLASYEFLPNLSNRKNIYNIYDTFLGKKEFSKIDYITPPTDTWLVNFNDLLFFTVNPNSERVKDSYALGDNNLRASLALSNLKADKVYDTLVLFKKESANNILLYETSIGKKTLNNQQLQQIDNGISFLGYTKKNLDNKGLLPLSLYFYVNQKINQDHQLRLKIIKENGESIFEKIYLLAYGLYPTTEWQPGNTITINYWLKLPDDIKNNSNQLIAELVKPYGYDALNPLGEISLAFSKIEPLKPSLNITAFIGE